uniref:Uncharacterized protein n=1 Tax=Setaria digitata TaxID=48799 RepID=A0A915PQQ7_9BILA
MVTGREGTKTEEEIFLIAQYVTERDGMCAVVCIVEMRCNSNSFTPAPPLQLNVNWCWHLQSTNEASVCVLGFVLVLGADDDNSQNSNDLNWKRRRRRMKVEEEGEEVGKLKNGPAPVLSSFPFFLSVLAEEPHQVRCWLKEEADLEV